MTALQMSMVMFRQAPRFSAGRLQAALAERWTDLAPAADISEQEGTLAFCIGELDVVIGAIAAPIPWSDLEGPCATSLLWPGAAAIVGDMRATRSSPSAEARPRSPSPRCSRR